MKGVIKFSASALMSRTQNILKSKVSREAIVKSFVLNQYEMMTTGCGFILSASETGQLVTMLFDEIIDTDPKTVRSKIVGLRRKLIEEYPFWIPNKLYLPITLAWMRVAHREEARAAFLDGLPFIQGMVIDSDHYAQLFIDCTHNPLSVKHPWLNTNAKPWHLPKHFFTAMKRAWPKNDGPLFDQEALILRLSLK